MMDYVRLQGYGDRHAQHVDPARVRRVMRGETWVAILWEQGDGFYAYSPHSAVGPGWDGVELLPPGTYNVKLWRPWGEQSKDDLRRAVEG